MKIRLGRVWAHPLLLSSGIAGCAAGPSDGGAPTVSATVASASTSASSPKVGPVSVRPRLIASRDLRTCGIAKDGRVECWGDWDPTPEPLAQRGAPQWVQGIDNALALSVGTDLGCAIGKTGKVWCWEPGPVLKAREVPEITAVDIAVVNKFACAVLPSGAVDCFVTSGKVVHAVKSGAAAIAAGDEHVCILQVGGTVACWGRQDMLGQNVQSESTNETRLFVDDAELVKLPGIGDVAQLVAGPNLTCVIDKKGEASCWGFNPNAPSNEAMGDRSPMPVASNIAEMSVGTDLFCLITRLGSVYCLGWGGSGYEVDNARLVSSGAGQSCFVTTAGTFECAGTTSRGALGNGEIAEIEVPRDIQGVEGAETISLTNAMGCAQKQDGSVLCWGGMRQDDNAVADAPFVFAPADHVTSMLASDERICMLSKTHSPLCTKPARPDGIIDTIAGLNKIVDATSVYDVSGSVHQGFMLVKGTVQLWRDGSAGATTVKLSKLSDVVAVRGSKKELCAVRRTGIVACAAIAKLDGSPFAPRDKDPLVGSDPVEVQGINDAVALATNSGRYCALRKNKQIACWETETMLVGEPGSPRPPLGQTRPGATLIATEWDGTTDATSVALGVHSVCATLASGAVTCGTLNGQHDKVSIGPGKAVPEINDATLIEATDRRACVVRKSGHVACWGDNSGGASGSTVPLFHVKPVPILPAR